MLIKTKLLIMATVPGFLLSVIMAFFVVSNSYNSNKNEMAHATDKIVKIASELVVIADENSMGNEERQRRLWAQRQQILDDALKNASVFFAENSEKTIFDDIVRNQKNSIRMFNTIKGIEDSIIGKNGTDNKFQKAYLSQIRSILLIELQSMMSHADMLKHLQHLDIIRRSNVQAVIAIFFFIMLFIGISVLSIVIIKGINKSIKSLINGTDAVSLGDLDYRVGLTIKDEFGHFSRSFDRMTEKLQNLTVSRDELLREITERKRAERELNKFRTIIEATTDFVGIADASGHVTYVNPAGLKLMGFNDNGDISETTIPDYFTEKSQAYILTQVIPLSIKQGSCSFESEFLSRSGQLIPFLGVSISHNAADGAVEFLSLIARDMTERKSMEEALLAEKKLSDEIIDSMPGLFYIFDARGKFLRWNKNLEKVTGYSSEEVAGLHPIDLFPEEDKSNVEQKIMEVFEYGQASIEAMMTAKDGAIIPYLFRGRLVKLGTSEYLAGLGIDITERRRTETELRRFTAIIEATTDFVGIAYPDGRTIYINPAGRKMLGIRKNEDISDIFIPDYHAVKSKKRVRTNTIPFRIEHGSVSFEDAFLSRSGQIIPFSGVALSHKNSGGEVEFLSLIARDITDRERMEEALIAEKDLSDSIIDSMPGIFYLFDTDGTILRWNSNSVLISGYSSDEIAASHPLDFFDGNYKHVIAGKIMEVFETGEASTEAELLTKDGRKIAFFLTGKRIIIGDSKYITGVGIDITQRRKAEKELKRFTDIIELTSDFVGIADARGKVLYANPAGRKMLGMGPDEDITNTSISEYFTEETGKYIQAVVVPLSIENRTFEYEAEFLSRSGTLVPFSGVSLSPKAPDGTVEFLSLIARDITERKKNEKEMIWLMTELQRSNKELEELAYVASHDLREPLRKIISFTELFAKRYRGKIDEKADVYIDYIVDGATRMSNLINDLLFYSRIMADDKQFEVIDCNVVLKRVLTDIQYFINENKAEITFDNLPEMHGNDLQMGQLFQNLITNAIKYQKDGGSANIHVSAVRRESEWIFSFKDNGIGIEAEYVERIFVLFQRLHSRSEYSGTGIGLAVCKKIVERHGGKIWVESEYGQGSTFYFSIPA